MPTALVFGASGAVGRYLLPAVPNDFKAIPISRQPRPNWHQADLNDPHAIWPTADVAISLGPLDAFAAWLQREQGHGLARIVALSSMSTQSKIDSPDPAERALALRLRDAEQSLIQTAGKCGAHWTILRPTLIYGAGTDKTLAPIARLARRWHMLPVPLGAHGLRQPVHAADLANACLAVLDKSACRGRIYELGGGECLPFSSMLRRLRAAIGGLILPLPVPMALLHASARFPTGALSRLRLPLLADNSAAIRDFGYAPRKFEAHDVLPD
jgi:nucleoside-diphosphate-sugar epimerase